MKKPKLNPLRLQIIAWGLSMVVCFVAFFAWAQGLRWHIVGVSTYKLFPIFGLLAFSLMWAHYVISVVRRHHHIDRDVTAQYFHITSLLVLLFICLHPGLLIFQLWRDGFGLPPGSYLHGFIAPRLEWAALLGTTSFFVFLAYELHRWFSDRSWWRFIRYGSDAAMLAILVHSLALGSNLRRGWFRYIWLFYGLIYLACLGYIYLAPKEPV